MADDDDGIGPDCFDFENQSFKYYVFDGSHGCDDCQDHSTAEPCEPPEPPHPSCGCDIVEKWFVLPPLAHLRCELLGVEEDFAAGEPQSREEHVLSNLPPVFEDYVRTGDRQPVDDFMDAPDYPAGQGQHNPDDSFTFDISFTAKIDHYEPDEDGDEGGDDDDDDGGEGDDDDGGEEDGGGDPFGGLCEEPEVPTDESGTMENSASASFYLDDLGNDPAWAEGLFFVIHYSVNYHRYSIRYRFYLVMQIGDDEHEVPLFEQTVQKFKSSGVTISEVEIDHR
jgi:hypothetical protein